MLRIPRRITCFSLRCLCAGPFSLQDWHRSRHSIRRGRLSYHVDQVLFYVRLENRAGALLFWSGMLRRDQMLQLSMCSSELHVEAQGYGAEDSHTAQRNYCESASLQRRVDVGLEVEVVLVVLIHP